MERIAYVIIVQVDNKEYFGTRDHDTILLIEDLPGALAFANIVDAAKELQDNFRDQYRGDAWLDPINLELYHTISADHKIVFNENVYNAVKAA